MTDLHYQPATSYVICYVYQFMNWWDFHWLMISSDSKLLDDKFADFNHKSRLICFANAVASLRSATRFAITSDERSAPVVTLIRHWLLPATGASRVTGCYAPLVHTCHWLLRTTGTSRVTGCYPPLVHHVPLAVTCTGTSPVTGCHLPHRHITRHWLYP